MGKQKKTTTESTMTLPLLPRPLILRFVVVVAAVLVFCIIPVVFMGCYCYHDDDNGNVNVNVNDIPLALLKEVNSNNDNNNDQYSSSFSSSSSSFLRPLFLSISPISLLSTATTTALATTTTTTTDSSPSTATTVAAARFDVNTNGDKNSQDLGVEDADIIPQVILITGATGRLGSKLYFDLQEKMKKQQHQQQHHNHHPIVEVRALVRNITKAKEVLQCTHCDASEGIYLGDVTDPTRDGGLMTATQDGTVTTVLIAAAAGIDTSPALIKAIEFEGVVNSVRAVAMNAKQHQHGPVSFLPNVVLCSSMGTTQLPDTDGSGSGSGHSGGHGSGSGSGSVFQAILHWKLNAEAFLSPSGIPSSIVKPCGLDDRLDQQNYTLFTGHFDQPSANHGVHGPMWHV